MWNKNEVKGKTAQAKGRVKQAVGVITGNRSLKSEGAADEKVGTLQAAVGRVQREGAEVIRKAGTAMKRGRTTAKIVLLFALVGVGVACTQKAADATKQNVDSALDATKSGANKAIDATKTAGDKTKEAAINTGNAVSDTWITGKLKAKFADESVLKGSDIQVTTNARVVTLAGTVGSITAKERAAAIAAGTDGVVSVVNNLTLK